MGVRKVLLQILTYLKKAPLFDLFLHENVAVCMFDVMILKMFLNGVQAEHYKTKR